jgi:hypothetical protein
MTEINEAVVNGTITSLTATLERATARLGLEEEEYNAKRDRMVAVAHQRGNDNSIGVALDDLLEEFGLPRRPVRGSLRALVMVTAPVSTTGETIMTDSSQYVYRNENVRVSWPVEMDYTASMREGDTCLCDNEGAIVRDWVRSYYGEPAHRTMSVQVGPTHCSIDDCPNRSGMIRPSTARAGTIAWHERPVYPFVDPEAAAAPEAERTPVRGETWYMAGDNLYGTSSREGEAVTIDRYASPTSIYVTRVSRATGWVLHREHIRPTP